jgi:hypothetical protein
LSLFLHLIGQDRVFVSELLRVGGLCTPELLIFKTQSLQLRIIIYLDLLELPAQFFDALF